ncbi:MAG: hypothetical protein Kow0075_05620 [Salibacteraceae bacterium]
MIRTNLYIIFSALGLLIGIEAIAQRGGNTAWKKYRHEVAINYGINTIFSKLGENDAIGVGFLLQRSSFQANYRYFVLKSLAVRGMVGHNFARKNDKEHSNDPSDNVRLDYKSSISEFGALAEYHFLDESNVGGNRGRIRRARGGVAKTLKLGISAYGGVALTYMRPYGEYFGNRVIFTPLNADPPNAPDYDTYRKLNLHFPIGLTIRSVPNEYLRIGLDIGYRIGIRDYINGTSAVYYIDGNPFPERIKDEDQLNKDFIGYITLADEQAPIQSLASTTGRSGYFVAALTVAIRFKSR